MKKILMCFLIAAPAFAQWRDSARVTGFFGGGVSAPINPIARSLDTGWNVTGGVGVTSKYVGVLVDGMFTEFGINHWTLVRSGFPRGDQRYWAVTVDPIVRVNPHGPVDFYITAGGGLYSQTTEFRTRHESRHDVIASYTVYKPGVNGGAGFAFNVGLHDRVKIFAEARFHHMFTRDSGASFVPVTVGVRF